MAWRRMQGAVTHRGNVMNIKGHLEDQNKWKEGFKLVEMRNQII